MNDDIISTLSGMGVGIFIGLIIGFYLSYPKLRYRNYSTTMIYMFGCAILFGGIGALIGYHIGYSIVEKYSGDELGVVVGSYTGAFIGIIVGYTASFMGYDSSTSKSMLFMFIGFITFGGIGAAVGYGVGYTIEHSDDDPTVSPTSGEIEYILDISNNLISNYTITIGKIEITLEDGTTPSLIQLTKNNIIDLSKLNSKIKFLALSDNSDIEKIRLIISNISIENDSTLISSDINIYLEGVQLNNNLTENDNSVSLKINPEKISYNCELNRFDIEGGNLFSIV